MNDEQLYQMLNHKKNYKALYLWEIFRSCIVIFTILKIA